MAQIQITNPDFTPQRGTPSGNFVGGEGAIAAGVGEAVSKITKTTANMYMEATSNYAADLRARQKQAIEAQQGMAFNEVMMRTSERAADVMAEVAEGASPNPIKNRMDVTRILAENVAKYGQGLTATQVESLYSRWNQEMDDLTERKYTTIGDTVYMYAADGSLRIVPKDRSELHQQWTENTIAWGWENMPAAMQNVSKWQAVAARDPTNTQATDNAFKGLTEIARIAEQEKLNQRRLTELDIKIKEANLKESEVKLYAPELVRDFINSNAEGIYTVFQGLYNLVDSGSMSGAEAAATFREQMTPMFLNPGLMSATRHVSGAMESVKGWIESQALLIESADLPSKTEWERKKWKSEMDLKIEKQLNAMGVGYNTALRIAENTSNLAYTLEMMEALGGSGNPGAQQARNLLVTTMSNAREVYGEWGNRWADTKVSKEDAVAFRDDTDNVMFEVGASLKAWRSGQGNRATLTIQAAAAAYELMKSHPSWNTYLRSLDGASLGVIQEIDDTLNLFEKDSKRREAHSEAKEAAKNWLRGSRKMLPADKSVMDLENTQGAE